MKKIYQLLSLAVFVWALSGIVLPTQATNPQNQSKDWSIVASYTIPGKASGLAWDGTYLYFGIYGSNGDKFYRFDPANGTNQLLFSIPAVNDSWGMTYDGTDLWIINQPSSSSQPAMATEISLATGTILSTFNLPDHYMSGIAYDNGNFWAATYYPDPGKIYKVSGTGTVLTQIPSPNAQPWDVCLQGSDLWVADYNAYMLYKIDQTGAILESHACQNQRPAGVVYDGTYLWYVDGPLSANSTLYKVDLGGAGTPAITVPVTTYNYGIVAIGDSAVWNITVNSTGTADLVINSLFVPNAVPLFHWMSFPQTVAPGNSLQIPLIFRPTALGQLNTNQVYIDSNDPVHPKVYLTLTGEGVYADPTIYTNGTSHNYGTVREGAHTRWFMEITNQGQPTLVVNDITLSDPHFYLDESVTFPFNVFSLNTRQVGIWFNPDAASTFEATAQIYSNDPVSNPLSFTLSGTGVIQDYPIGTTLWNYTITGGTDDSPKGILPIPDITGDGIDDVVISSEDNVIRCFNGNASGTGDVLWFNAAGSVYSQSGLALMEDIDNDGYRDVATGLVWGARAVKALSGKTGLVLWTYDTHVYGDGGWVYQVDAKYDYNNDGFPDVLAATGNDGNNTGPKRIFCLNGLTGIPIWECYTDGPNFAVIGVEDFNGDGKPDVIGGASNASETQGKIIGINGATGGIQYTMTTTGSSVWALGQLDDINGNGVKDVFAGDFGGRYYLVDPSTAVQLYTYTIGSVIILRCERLDDVNGDGYADILVGHSGTNCVVINGFNGQNIWLQSLADKCWNVDRITDISGDGINDVIAGTLYSSNYCYFLNGTDGSVLHSVFYDEPVDAIAAIPDITHDGSMEMVAGGRYGKVTCYSGGLNSGLLLPDFMADITTVSLGGSVQFTDLTLNNPTNWSWKFEGGTPATSTEQNPLVVYNTVGQYDVTLIVSNAFATDSITKEDYITVEFTGITVDLKAFLQGPFTGTQMNTNLNGLGFLPLNQPYNTAPWNYNGTESVAAIPNADVVEWVLVELRDAATASQATSATMIGRQAGFILDDGSVRASDGSSLLNFNATVTQNLFALIWHRNHLAVISANPLALTGGIYSYDFSSGVGQVLGGINGHKELATGTWGMLGGDGNSNNTVNNQDKVDIWKPQSGSSGYLTGDFDMNGNVNNQDKLDIWAPNGGMSSQIPY